MRRSITCLLFILTLLLTIQLVMPPIARLNTIRPISHVGKLYPAPSALTSAISPLTPAAQQTSTLKIIDIANKKPPVINENRQATVALVDANGQVATDATFSSQSPDIAMVVDPVKGIIKGINQGYATIVATRANGQQTQEFAVITRVNSGKSDKLTGKSAHDDGSTLYLSDPVKQVILKKDIGNSSSTLERFAGTGVKGIMDGNSLKAAQFDGPLGVSVDNRGVGGGIYIADTNNNSIRKVEKGNVVTVLGSSSGIAGTPGGLMSSDSVTFNSPDEIGLNGPQGIAIDSKSNLYICDTNNNAIYIVNFATRTIKLLAGAPGQPGDLRDGRGRDVRFRQPNNISLVDGEKILQVVDTGNNLLRQIDVQTGEALPYGKSTSFTGQQESLQPAQAAINGIPFNTPTGIATDSAGNIYVIDNTGAQIVTFPVNQPPLVLPLAQPGQSFTAAANITIKGTQAIVVDAGATNTDEALKTVTVGAPKINNLSQTSAPIAGGVKVVITGSNFAPETRLILADSAVADFTVDSATQISFTVPKQSVPGNRTLSVITRGGVDQVKFGIIAESLTNLSQAEITTFAGGIRFIGDGGRGELASLNFPTGVAIDSNGNLYIADAFNHRVRRVDVNTGVIVTIAGNGVANFSGDGMPAISAGLNTPENIAIAGNGDLFITDVVNQLVRRVDAVSGIISTYAGNGKSGVEGDNGPAINASLNSPNSIAVDSAGNLIIADTNNFLIRRVDAQSKIITTIAGNRVQGAQGDGGAAVNASFGLPSAVTVDSDDNIFIADSLNNKIRKIAARTGIITTVVGNGSAGFSPDGSAAISAINSPSTIAVDGFGNIYFDDNNRVRKIDALSQTIVTVAGNGQAGFSGDGARALNAQIGAGVTITIDDTGNLLIADFKNNRVRVVDSKGIINTIAGSGATGLGNSSFDGDGNTASLASLDSPAGLAVDETGNLIFADTFNHRIRQVDAAGIITTIVGSGATGLLNGSFSGDGGIATAATMNAPMAVTLDNAGNLIVADTFNNRIRKIDAASRTITTIAGTGEAGFNGDGLPALSSKMFFPSGLAVDRDNNIYFSDTLNNLVRRIDAKTNTITTIAGNGDTVFNGDMIAATTASLKSPAGIAVDKSGNIFIADSQHNRIRKVAAQSGNQPSLITTVAGNGLAEFAGDGQLATNASISMPSDVVIDDGGNLFIADAPDNRVREVVAETGIIKTVAGSGPTGLMGGGFDGDGGPATMARLTSPFSIAIDKTGNLFISDNANNIIRVVKEIATGQGDGQGMVTITAVSFGRANLTIDGSGFGAAGAQVNINGQDVSARIVTESASTIVLKGNKKKLKLKSGENQITVTVKGVSSNIFVLNLLNAEGELAEADPTAACPTITFTPAPADLPSATLNVAYAPVTFQATGGQAPYQYDAAVSLPVGMTFDRSVPTLKGTPLQTGSFKFTVAAIDANGCIATQGYTLVVVGVGMITSFDPDTGQAGDQVVITGTDFLNSASVTFNGTSANFVAVSPFIITAKVPANATTGPIAVKTPSGLATSVKNFTVLASPPPNFSITIAPSSQTVVAGGTANYNINISSSGGFDSQLSISSSNLPPNASIPAFSGSSPIPFQVVTGSATPAGTYTFTLTATGGGITHTANATIIVQPKTTGDFSLAIAPASQTVAAGDSADYAINISNSGGFSSAINFTASNLPAGASIPNLQGTSPMVAFKVLTSTATPVGSFKFIITGTGGGITHTATATLVVQAKPTGDFSIAITPGSQTVTAGNSAGYTINVSNTGGFSSAINFTAANLPAGATIPSIQGTSPIAIQVLTSATTPAGSYPFTITGTGGGLTRTATAMLIVQSKPTGDFSLAITPASQTVSAGGSADYAINISSNGDFAGLIDFNVSNLPAGASAENFQGGSPITFQVVTSAATPPGTYTFTVTGTSGGLIRTATSMLIVQANQDFTLSVDPTTMSVSRGEKGNIVVLITRNNGFSGKVTVTPSNTKAIKVKLTPPSMATNGSSVVFNFKIKKGAPTGSQQVIFTGTDSSGLVQTATLTLDIQ